METFGIKEQEGGNHAITIDGQPVNNRSEDGQVCVS
jgi:hypothetical protein